MTDLYIARHHAAGTYILKAIRAGELGAAVIQSDIGSQKKHNKEGLPTLPRDIPINQLPETLHDIFRQHTVDEHVKSIPDITLLDTVTENGQDWHRLTFVEVKYCNDTNPAAQREHAHQQHAQLLARVNQSDYYVKARLIVILLGAAGYIYSSDTQQPLTRLGVTGASQKTLMRNLHLQAVKSLTQIISIRRHKERKRRQKQLKHYYKSTTQHNPLQQPATTLHKIQRPKKPPDPT